MSSLIVVDDNQPVIVNEVTNPVVAIVNESTRPIVAVVYKGQKGDTGVSGSTGYSHTQENPSNAWTINHNLHRKPSVTVFFEGSTIEGTPIHNSDDVAVVTFAVAIAGTAHCI